MDFVFMLTRSDQTVTDCLDVLDDIRPLGLAHIGFKDVGVSPDVLAKLVLRIKAAGATSYMEVVSTSREACLRSAQVARDIGVDRLLGGTQVEEVLNIVAGSTVALPAIPWRPIRTSNKARGLAGPDRRRLPPVSRHGLRRRRPARLPGNRGRSARIGARGAARRRRHPAGGGQHP